MRRLCVLACALLFGLGCATEGDKSQWNEAWKDLRGDNLQMKSDGAAIGGWGNDRHN